MKTSTRLRPAFNRERVWIACCAAILCMLALSASAQNLGKRFGNQDVVDLVQLGVSDDVIIAKIRSVAAGGANAVSFDTSVDGIRALKAAHVSDPVIEVMINPAPPTATLVTPTAAVTLGPDLPPPEVGVYWKDGSNFVLIPGQILSQAKIGGRAGSMFTYGLRGLHWDAYLSGPTSAHVVKDRRPSFYIYVPDGATSSDYTLLKLTKKGDRREFQVGGLAGKVSGGKTGVKKDKEVGFTAEHVGIRMYKITLSDELPPGEYAFFMATGEQIGATDGQGAGGAATGRIYDFRIPG